MTTKAFSVDERDEYDDEFQRGAYDAIDGVSFNDNPQGTPGWLGYRDGQKSQDNDTNNSREYFDATDGHPNCDDAGTGEGRYHGRM